ncbi:MAG TPA: hypothetical protein DCY13_13215, partial [Verrucomicrobiales bacterium]|nr:hypothetical protein [Verrucomicrobiales bacterium]
MTNEFSMRRRVRCTVAALFTSGALATGTLAADYSTTIARLEPLIGAEMADWQIGGIAVAL